IAITLDSGTVYATYLSGSGTDELTFRHTIQAGHLDLDGISLGYPLDVNGGTIRDAAGNAASTTLANVDNPSGVTVDGVAPAVQSIVPASSATTNATTVQWTVTFSEDVTDVTLDDFELVPQGGTTAAGT